MSVERCGTCYGALNDKNNSIKCIGPCQANYHLNCAKIDKRDLEFLIVDNESTYKCHDCTRRKSDMCVTPIPKCWFDEPEESRLMCSQTDLDINSFQSLIVNQFDLLKENGDSILCLIRELTSQVKDIAAELNILKRENATLKCLLSEYVRDIGNDSIGKQNFDISLKSLEPSMNIIQSNGAGEPTNISQNSILGEDLAFKIVHKKVSLQKPELSSSVNCNGNKSIEKIIKIEARIKSGDSAVSMKSKMMALSEDNISPAIIKNEELLKKMTVTRSFPWKLVNFLLLLTIAGLLSYDINKHGSFKSSSTGRFLNDVGALEYGEHAWATTKTYSNKSFRWAEENLPHYYKVVSEYSKPYLDLGWDICLVIGHQLCNMYENINTYVEEKTPIVIDSINHYAPGLLEKIKVHSIDAWDFIKHNGLILWQYSLDYSSMGIDWVKTNIFVGNLSPENLQKYSMEALNTTQVYAVWTYDWVCRKVQTLSKIQ